MKNTLYSKILIILTTAFLLLGGTGYFIYHHVLLPNLIDLERQHIKENIDRVVHSIGNELEHLSVLTNDWAAWDDTYEYIKDKNPDYEESNLGDSTFSLNKLNLIYYIDTSGLNVWGKSFAEDFETPISVQPFDQQQFPRDFPFLNYGSTNAPLGKQYMSGLILTSAGPLLAASRPILDSNNNGPSHGTLIMGRLLAREMIEKISSLTDINFKIKPLDETWAKGEEEIWIQPEDNMLHASTVIKDVFSQPALTITVSEDRKIYNQGIRSLNIAMAQMFFGFSFALALMLWMLRSAVVTPINHMARSISSWRESSVWSTPDIGPHVSREIALLAMEFDHLIKNLEGKIHDLAQHQDHLEVLVDEKTRELKEAQAELLRRERLSTLGRLTATVSHEVLNPLATVRNAIYILQHAIENNDSANINRGFKLAERNIIRSIAIIEELNEYTRIKGLTLAQTELDGWLERILKEQIIPEEIICERAFSSGVLATFDQEKLRQVIVNLFNNAIHALQGTDSENKTLKVSTTSSGNAYEIRFEDNGIGMSDKTIEKIYEPLYSTKNFGLGLGMAIVKKIIEQHGGSITIISKENKGATIMLNLPLKPPQSSADDLASFSA